MNLASVFGTTVCICWTVETMLGTTVSICWTVDTTCVIVLAQNTVDAWKEYGCTCAGTVKLCGILANKEITEKGRVFKCAEWIKYLIIMFTFCYARSHELPPF